MMVEKTVNAFLIFLNISPKPSPMISNIMNKVLGKATSIYMLKNIIINVMFSGV